jgi:hypothetical protein
MKKLIYLVAMLAVAACHNGSKSSANNSQKKLDTTGVEEKKDIQYSDQQLEQFLDSVGLLPTQPLANKAAFGADSIFKSPRRFDTLISPTDIKILKHAMRKGVMVAKTARRIFNNNEIRDSCNTKGVLLTYKVGLIPVLYYPFNTGKEEYGICIGDPDECQNACLYFFKGNNVIAKHDLYTRHSDKLRWFTDEDGESVVYYCKEFDEGSGVWWFNYYFYKYDGYQLVPALNELENANLLQPSPWAVRELWFESSIQKTNPLTIKMVYHQQLPDTGEIDDDTTRRNQNPLIVNDSTIVKYSWDRKSKTFEGGYNQLKISKPQILSYYVVDNEQLFINSHYNRLKGFLSDKKTRKITLHYLNIVKNHEGRVKQH